MENKKKTSKSLCFKSKRYNRKLNWIESGQNLGIHQILLLKEGVYCSTSKSKWSCLNPRRTKEMSPVLVAEPHEQ